MVMPDPECQDTPQGFGANPTVRTMDPIALELEKRQMGPPGQMLDLLLCAIVAGWTLGHSPAPVSPTRPSQVHDHGASVFPVSVLNARDRTPLHAQKRSDRLSPHPVATPWGSLIKGDCEPKKQTLSDASCCMKAHTFAPRAYY